MDDIHGRSSSTIAMTIIGGLFFVFGFVTWLNGALIPFLTIACELDHLQAYFVTLVFYIAYTVMAVPMSLVLRRTGYKNGLVLGAVTLFFYVGAEVVAGDTIALFGRDLGVVHFGGLTACTMAFMMCGYLVGVIAIPRWITQERALAVSAALGILLSILVLVGDMESNRIWEATFAWTGFPGVPDAVLFVAFFGLANALVWPAVWPMALRGLNRDQTGTGSALLIMGIAGGAIVPVIFGALTEYSADPRVGYGVMLPCYLFILYYALAGHKLEQWTRRLAQKTVRVQ